MSDIDQKAAGYAWIGEKIGAEQHREQLRWQQYSSRATIVSSPRGTHIVYGEIARLYHALDGPSGGLGAPVTDELDAGDQVGRYNDFERGSIYWSPITGAHEVHGNIGVYWVGDGRAAGPLGYPITDELSHPPYAYQFFQHGALTWTAADGVRRGSPPHRLFGVADTHAHPAAHLGFGGGLISGLVEGPPEEALADCSRNHGVGGTGFLRPDANDLGAGAAGAAAAWLLGPLVGLVTAAASDAAQGGTLAGLEGTFSHATGGHPTFDGWPRHNSRVHQQMYLPWVERSYRHGVRLMVALANHSNVLAGLAGDDRSQRDWDAGMAQIDYLNDLVGRVEWMEVARTWQEARDLVAADKLAVILGVELDTLGGLEQPARDWSEGAAGVTDAELDALINQLWIKNVRYFFPVHLTDNAFGGTAVYRDEFVTGSFLEGREIHTEPRPDLAFGKANRHGLSDAGRRLITKLMAKGALIDIDHMSWKATEDALAHTAAERYPLVSGHATFHELAVPGAHADAGGSDESRKRPETLLELARRGSFVGVQPVAQPLAPHPDVDARVNADCPGSSTQFAGAYLYAVAKTGGRVTIGTDLNGFATTCGPRFGPNAAPGLAEHDSRRMVEENQQSGVRYTTQLQHVVEGRLERPGHMWTARRRVLLNCVHFAETDRPASPAPASFGLDLFAVVQGLRINREPTHPAQRAAYRARRGLGPDGLPPAERELFDDLVWVLQRHRSMRGGANPPLDRCVTGGHDWDYNLEGLAHYGLLPDMLADLGNLGLAWDSTLLPLLTSAETVVSTWERCNDPGARTQPFSAPASDPRTLEPRPRFVKPGGLAAAPRPTLPSLG